MKPTKLVYVSHPYRQYPANLARAKRWVAYLARKHRDWVISAPWILWAELGLYANDEEAALQACCLAIEGCDELITVGTRELTLGMRDEWSHAFANGVEARVYATELEPPREVPTPEQLAALEADMAKGIKTLEIYTNRLCEKIAAEADKRLRGMGVPADRLFPAVRVEEKPAEAPQPASDGAAK